MAKMHGKLGLCHPYLDLFNTGLIFFSGLHHRISSPFCPTTIGRENIFGAPFSTSKLYKSRPNKAESCQRLEKNGLPGKTGWKELHVFFSGRKTQLEVVFFCFLFKASQLARKMCKQHFSWLKMTKKSLRNPPRTELFPHTSSYSYTTTL